MSDIIFNINLRFDKNAKKFKKISPPINLRNNIYFANLELATKCHILIYSFIDSNDYDSWIKNSIFNSKNYFYPDTISNNYVLKDIKKFVLNPQAPSIIFLHTISEIYDETFVTIYGNDDKFNEKIKQCYRGQKLGIDFDQIIQPFENLHKCLPHNFK